MTKLKPCPFCGSDDLYIQQEVRVGHPCALVHCQTQDCPGSSTMVANGLLTTPEAVKEVAIDMWNLRRPAPDLVEALEEIVSSMEANGMGEWKQAKLARQALAGIQPDMKEVG